MNMVGGILKTDSWILVIRVWHAMSMAGGILITGS